jgi:synaptotagmin-like protein
MEHCGEMIISLKYVPMESIKTKKSKKKKEGGELHVQIKEAHNLKAKDANGFSDPFCKVYVVDIIWRSDESARLSTYLPEFDPRIWRQK